MTSQDRETLEALVRWIDQIPYDQLDRSGFDQSFVRLGVASVLIDLGELSQQLSALTREALPNVPWVEMIAIRHVLAHETDSVDYSKVWTAVQDLPRIRGAIAAHLA